MGCTVVEVHGMLVTVLTADGERVRARPPRDRTTPVIGDRVALVEDGGVLRVVEIARRERVFVRPNAQGGQLVAAHVDRLVIVTAVEPGPRPGLIDRMWIALGDQPIEVVLVLNKCDLPGTEAAAAELADHVAAGAELVRTSTKSGEGIAALGARLARASALIKLGQTDAAGPIAAAVADEARALGHPPLYGEALLVRGATEDKARVEATLREALTAAADGHDDRLAVMVWADLIFRVSREHGRHADARAWELAAEAALRRAGDAPEAEARLRQALGDARFAAGAYAEARAQLERALEVATAIDPEHPRVATALRRLGGVDTQQGRLDDARRRLEQVVAFWERTLGPDHHHVAVASNDLGLALQKQGALPEARRHLERALAIWERTLGPDHVSLGHALNNLALVALAQGEHAQARAFVARALAIWEPALGPDHLNVIAAVVTEADVELAAARPDEACARYERARAALARTVGLDHPYAPYAFTGLAECLLAQGRAAEALPHAERAVALRAATEVAADERARSQAALDRARAALRDR